MFKMLIFFVASGFVFAAHATELDVTCQSLSGSCSADSSGEYSCMWIGFDPRSTTLTLKHEGQGPDFEYYSGQWKDVTTSGSTFNAGFAVYVFQDGRYFTDLGVTLDTGTIISTATGRDEAHVAIIDKLAGTGTGIRCFTGTPR